MTYFPSLLPRLHKSRILSPLLNRWFSSTGDNLSVQRDPVSIRSTQNPAIVIANKLSNCRSLNELNQIYAHIIRTYMLQLHSASFHWNNLIRSYSRLDDQQKALHVYISMSRAGVLPDSYTLPIVLKSVTLIFAVDVGRQVHSIALKLGLQSNEYCETGFINLYGKAGNFKSALQVFDENTERKLGSWNAIISCFGRSGRAREVIEMFIEMKRAGFQPDDVTMVSVTSACAGLGDLNLAMQLHKCVLQAKTFERSDILMLNSLIDMYGKCGRTNLAYNVFSRMEERNVSTWTSMIVGFAIHGHVNEALGCFRSMSEADVRPNNVTFVAVLSACVHGGKVEEGKHFFNMLKGYGIKPQLEHYGCMVDLLGRAGLMEEARRMVEEMPMKANVVIWGCLMGACEKHGNVEMGEWVAKHLQQLEPWNDGGYVVLSNIYANRGLWKEVERVREFMKEMKLEKVAGFSLPTRCY